MSTPVPVVRFTFTEMGSVAADGAWSGDCMDFSIAQGGIMLDRRPLELVRIRACDDPCDWKRAATTADLFRSAGGVCGGGVSRDQSDRQTTEPARQNAQQSQH